MDPAVTMEIAAAATAMTGATEAATMGPGTSFRRTTAVPCACAESSIIWSRWVLPAD